MSRLATDTNTRPLVGSAPYAASCDFANAVPKPASMPITSPVDFISGPSTVSTPVNRFQGMTASFTQIAASSGKVAPSPAGSSRSARSSAMLAPSITLAAALASGTAVAFDTNGTVRLARGLASRT